MVESAAVLPIPLGLVAVFVIRGERPILVDTGYSGSERRILARLASTGIDPARISLILLTHAHADHVGNARVLRERTGAPLAMHRQAAAELAGGRSAPVVPFTHVGRLFTAVLGILGPDTATHDALKPDVIIDQRLDLSDYGAEGEVVWTPSHSSGSVSVFLKSGQAIVGDLIMGGMLLRRRTPGPPFIDSDRDALDRSIATVIARQPHTIYAAHGGPFTLESVRVRFASSS